MKSWRYLSKYLEGSESKLISDIPTPNPRKNLNQSRNISSHVQVSKLSNNDI